MARSIRFTLAAIAMVLSSVASAETSRMSNGDIVALDAIALRAAIAEGRVSAERVTAAYLERIAAVDDAGPMLSAVIETNPDALAIARALDRRRAAGMPLGSLHGVPVLLKANIDTGDRLATSAGSLALARHRAAADADVAALLRAAGAVILGKTNLSEWANFRSPNSTSGWSSLGGQTRNPYVLERNPCGSSSGSAVAVAAGLAPLAVGTETDGSIVCPSATNGVLGIKPTRGTVSRRGIVPIASSQDTAGPIARTASDAALLLQAIAPAAKALEAPRGTSVHGRRIAVLRDYVGAGEAPDVERNVAAVVAWLREAGVDVVDGVAASPSPRVRAAEQTLLLAEFRDGIERYLNGVRRGPRTLADLIEFNAINESAVMPHFGQELLTAARDGGGVETASYAAAKLVIDQYAHELAEVFDALKLDALLAPANARAWRTDWAAGDRFTVGSSSIAAITGYPSIAVPTALVNELPLGVALVARPNQEALLLDLAVVLERGRGPFPAPRYLPSTGGAE